jgi:hypothetical protein
VRRSRDFVRVGLCIGVIAALALMEFCSSCQSDRADAVDAQPDSGCDSGIDTDAAEDAGIDADAGGDAGVDASTDSGADAACPYGTTFADELIFPIGDGPDMLAVADFNKDGIQDLAVTTVSDDAVGIILGEGDLDAGVGDGSFSPMASYPAGDRPYGIDAADFNGDGILDLAVTNFPPGTLEPGTVSVLLGHGADGHGDGSFGDPVAYGAYWFPWSVKAADFDSDGIFDLVVADAVPLPSANSLQILFGNGTGGVGDGTFSLGELYSPPSPTMLAVGDLDSDGILDIVVAGNSTDTVTVLWGDGADGIGDGTFTCCDGFAVGDQPRTIVIDDFNEDGHPDIAVQNNVSQDVSVLLGTGLPGADAFEDQVIYEVFGFHFSLVSADFNRDGVLDLAVPNGYLDSSVSVLYGHGSGGVGDGTFSAPETFPVCSGPSPLGTGDFNGDGLIDIVAIEGAGTFSVLLGEWCE